MEEIDVWGVQWAWGVMAPTIPPWGGQRTEQEAWPVPLTLSSPSFKWLSSRSALHTLGPRFAQCVVGQLPAPHP